MEESLLLYKTLENMAGVEILIGIDSSKEYQILMGKSGKFKIILHKL
jgi:hypothetical protein